MVIDVLKRVKLSTVEMELFQLDYEKNVIWD